MRSNVTTSLPWCLVLTSFLGLGCSDSAPTPQTEQASFALRTACARPVDQSTPVLLTRSLLDAANQGDYGCIAVVLDSLSQKAVLEESDLDVIARDYGHTSQRPLHSRIRAALDQGQFELLETEPGVSLLQVQVGGALGSVQLSFVNRGGRYFLRREKTNSSVTPSFMPPSGGTRLSARPRSATLKDGEWDKAPAPIWVLKTARTGQNFRDSLAGAVDGATSYQRMGGAWPDGLVLDETSGEITGRPSKPGAYEAVIGATVNGNLTPVRVVASIFSSDETEIKPGQDLSAAGPYSVGSDKKSYSYSPSFNVAGYHPRLGHPRSYDVDVLTFYPKDVPAGTSVPALIFQHATGFDFDEYQKLFTRIASHGFAVVSAAEYHSFLGRNYRSSQRDDYFGYDNAVAGMQEGSATQEALIGFLDKRNQGGYDPRDPLRGKVDMLRLFMMGHSRGGGSTQASHARSMAMGTTAAGTPYGLRGVIYMQAYDLRSIPRSPAAPPGRAPVYPIADVESRTPFLEISSELDGDLVYPITDTMIERATGPATQITIYGANHNQMGDNHSHESGGTPKITRDKQREIASKWMLAFLKRWGQSDLSLEGYLYGGEHMGSTEVAVQSNRNMTHKIMVDDFQGTDTQANTLGFAREVSSEYARFGQGTIYPSGAGSPASGLSSLPMTSGWFRLSIGTGSTDSIPDDKIFTLLFRSGLAPDGTSLVDAKRLVFRLGLEPYRQWTAVRQMDLDVSLKDIEGRKSSVRLYDRKTQTSRFLPVYSETDTPHTRFERYVQVEVPLQDFVQAAGGDLDLKHASSVELDLQYLRAMDRSGLWLDDLRFE